MAYLPCSYNLINMLASAGHRVDVFTVASTNTVVRFQDNRISVFEMNRKFESCLRRWIPNVLAFLNWVLTSTKHSYDVCIGVDPPGLVSGYLFSKFKHVPFLVYESLELMLSYDKTRIWYPQYVWMEKRLILKAAFVITQDHIRAELMAADSRIPLSKILTFPNAPIGPPRLRRSNYLKEKFQLAETDFILLYAGSLGEWAWSSQLVEASRYWPTNHKLIMHVRGSFAQVRAFFNNSLPQNVLVSNADLPNDLLDDVIDSCDIGLVFYDHESPNIKYVGHASGKLCHFLRCGKPVISNMLPLISDQLIAFSSGFSVTAPNKIMNAANFIISNYPRFQKGALRHFETELLLEKHFSPINTFLETLVTRNAMPA